MENTSSISLALSNADETTTMSPSDPSNLAANDATMSSSLSTVQIDQVGRSPESTDSFPAPAREISELNDVPSTDYSRRAAFIVLSDIGACKHESNHPSYKYAEAKLGDQKRRFHTLEQLAQMYSIQILVKKKLKTPNGPEYHRAVRQTISRFLTELDGIRGTRTEELWRKGWDAFDFLTEERHKTFFTELQAAASRVEAVHNELHPYDVSSSLTCVEQDQDGRPFWFTPAESAACDSDDQRSKTTEPLPRASVVVSTNSFSHPNNTEPSGAGKAASPDHVPHTRSVTKCRKRHSEDHGPAEAENANEEDSISLRLVQQPQRGESYASANGTQRQKRQRHGKDVEISEPSENHSLAPQTDAPTPDVLNAVMRPSAAETNRGPTPEGTQRVSGRTNTGPQLFEFNFVPNPCTVALAPSYAWLQYDVPPSGGGLSRIAGSVLRETWRALFNTVEELVDDLCVFTGYRHEDTSGAFRDRDFVMPLLEPQSLTQPLLQLYEQCWGECPERTRAMAQEIHAFGANKGLTSLISAFLYEHVLSLPTPIELSIAKRVACTDVSPALNIADFGLAEELANANARHLQDSRMKVKQLLSEASKSDESHLPELTGYVEELISLFWVTFRPQLDRMSQIAKLTYCTPCEPAITSRDIHGVLTKLFQDSHQRKVELAGSGYDYLVVWPDHATLYDGKTMQAKTSSLTQPPNTYVAMTNFPGLKVRYEQHRELFTQTFVKAEVTIIHENPLQVTRV